MKEQDKTPEKQLNEVEIGHLSEKEFRIMIVKMIQDLGKTMEKMQEMFTKDLEKLKNKQRYTRRNQQISSSDLEDRMVDITAKEQNIEKRMEEDS